MRSVEESNKTSAKGRAKEDDRNARGCSCDPVDA